MLLAVITILCLCVITVTELSSSLAWKDVPIQFQKHVSVEGHSCSVVLSCRQLTTQREQPLHVGLWGWICHEIMSKLGKCGINRLSVHPELQGFVNIQMCRRSLRGSAAAQSWHLVHLQPVFVLCYVLKLTFLTRTWNVSLVEAALGLVTAICC